MLIYDLGSINDGWKSNKLTGLILTDVSPPRGLPLLVADLGDFFLDELPDMRELALVGRVSVSLKDASLSQRSSSSRTSFSMCSLRESSSRLSS